MGRLLVVEDEESQRRLFVEHIGNGHQVIEASNAAEGLQTLARTRVDALVTDIVLPDNSGWWLVDEARKIDPHLPVIIMSAQDDLLTARKAITIGALEFFPKTWDRACDIEQFRRAVEKAVRLAELQHRVDAAAASIARQERLRTKLIAVSPAMVALAERIKTFGPSDATVLIEGPSGAGKDVVARTIHATGRVASGPFVVVSVPALQPTLMESELFGHVRGAFTDAHHDRIGAFEQADHGTLFLDEVGDLPLDLQAKLLRAVEVHEISRVGDTRAIPLDLRIIAATNRDIECLVAQGLFREDLYHRLNAVRIRVPPLRERVEDIQLLAEHFLAEELRKAGRDTPRQIDDDALAMLRQYAWPGNVRELKHIVGRLVWSCRAPTITAASLVHEGPFLYGRDTQIAEAGAALKDRLVACEKRLVLEAMAQSRGRLRLAAKIYGEHYNTFRERIARLGIRAQGYCERRPSLRASRERVPQRCEQPHLLFVDDDFRVRKAFARAGKSRYRVTLAESGQEALDILVKDHGVDVILLDVLMPKMDGVEVYRRVAQVRPEMAKRCAFVTGACDFDPTESLGPAVTVPVLYKPFSIEQLQSVVECLSKGAEPN